MTWDNGSIMIRGEEVPVRTGLISIMDLKYFVDNPRIYSVVRADGEVPDQDEIQNRLWNMDHVKELRLDIEQNGGLIDPLIVKDVTFDVLEGNSRLAAYRKLAEKDPIKWGEVKCTLLPEDIAESKIFSLLGQYHIRGKKDWSPYEQAGFLYRRHEQHQISVTDLGKELGIGRLEASKLIRVYKLMIDRNDTDTSRWSYYYEYLSSAKLGKIAEKYPGFEEAILKKIRSGKIVRASDIRDKVAKIPITSKKVVKELISGELTVEEAFERVEASGGTDVSYNKIRKFRVWLGSDETSSSLKTVASEARNKIDYEIKRLVRETKKIQKILEE